MSDTTKELMDEIFELLEDKKWKTIVLVGEPRVGKASMAKSLSDRAIEKNLFDFCLWVFRQSKYDKRALQESIAHQLSILSISEEWEVEDDNKETQGKEEDIWAKLEQRIFTTLEGKNFLLILDDEGNKTNEEIKKLLDLFREKASKVLITAIKKDDSSESEGKKVIEVKASYNTTQFLHSARGMLPQGVLIDWCRGGSHFFRDRGVVHCNELIAYWIMEGYLGDVDCIEKAYDKGYQVVMELTDCRMLKPAVDGYVIMEGAMMTVDGYNRSGFDGTVSLGLASVFKDGEWEGLGRITQADGMIKTLRCGKGQKLSTLLLDGNRPWEEVRDMFPKLDEELQTLALFNPTIKSLPLPLSKLHTFRVLVLRGCDFLENITLNETPTLGKLTVLEISGSGSLRTIPANFFEHMPQLRSLNLSSLQIKSLPSSLYGLTELVRLVLRGCSCLETLESLKNCKKLLELDLFGTTALKSIRDKKFSENKKLQLLNLSHSQIRVLPLIKDLVELTCLLLSGCTRLDKLCSISTITCLEVLDLSNSTQFKEFHNQLLENNAHHKIRGPPSNMVEIKGEFFKGKSQLRVLNLSGTKVKRLPSLSNLVNLHQLLLSYCLDLVELPDLKSLGKLETLDLTCCRALTKIPDLPESKIECQPSDSSSNLRRLLLKECTKLTALPPLESLSKLEELNLYGISCLKGIEADFLQCMTRLQILDLSESMLPRLPNLSNLQSLKQLFLRNLDLKKVPGLEALTQLEVLDLSGTSVRVLPSLDQFSNLRRLVLKDCSGLTLFPRLDTPDHVFQGTVKYLPYGISKLTHLDYLHLPHTKKITGADNGRMKGPPEDPNQYQWNISSFPAVALANIDGSSVPVSGNQLHDESSVPPVSGRQFLQFLEKNKSVWDKRFTKFHFCVHPSEGQNEKGGRYLHRNEHIFNDIYFQTTQFAQFKERRSLQIRAFDKFPKGIEDVLSHADCVFLIDNDFGTLLSGLSASNLVEMSGCWIERCREMEVLFSEEEAEEFSKVGTTLNILGISNAPKLKRIYSDNQQFVPFQNLESLYLDCCPQLSTVFSSWQPPPKNLEVLQIKFCDKLERLFSQTSADGRLRYLVTLHLWELPKLKEIGCALPSLQTLKVWGCPELQKLEEHIKAAESLQILWISNVKDLKCLYSGSPQPGTKIFNNLETLQIISCDKLEWLFHSTSGYYTLPKLRVLHLRELLKLEIIGGELPSMKDRVIMECPNFREDSPPVA